MQNFKSYVLILQIIKIKRQFNVIKHDGLEPRANVSQLKQSMRTSYDNRYVFIEECLKVRCFDYKTLH